MKKAASCLILCGLLAACESNPPAPVIDRLPESKSASPSAKPTQSKPVVVTTGKDWRPDTYTVKKGDNLLRIGLEFGYDYKEIAAANNIPPPYSIKVGQVLNFAPLKSKPVNEPANADGVVVSTVKTSPGVTETTNATAATAPSAVTPVLSEPRATREPYSVEAMNRPVSKPADAKTADTKTTDGKVAESKPADAKPADDEAMNWSWPTQGKVIGSFNESTNKGIDIAGNTGQAINAAAPGKVIYTGSDLRGYGKLVIIKHNKTYLSVYAHNSKILVKEGQTVQAGQKIAEMGNTDSNTVKLHFEIRRQGKSVDPTKYLSQD
ncbi:MAG TPA: peptidoglycan DD-metalloendopeptidase family protein [Methylophilus sp.]|nr:peptidoglycan DD-metalloendopeptidase family protein [Methylophilus sp.]HQQ32853.1 peptidoglycan DD-metalloendopeptidase family protein [Methylophilus sp.]